MLARRLHLADFVQHTSQVEVGQCIPRIESDGAPEVFGSLLEIPILIMERTAIEQRVDPLRVRLQGAVISANRLGACSFARFASQGPGKPVISTALACAGWQGNDADALVNFARFKVQNKLPGKRFKASAMAFDDDVS